MNKSCLCAIFCLGLAGSAMAQSEPAIDHAAQMNGQMPMHGQMSKEGQMPQAGQVPGEPGQSAFATIAEIVAILRADPDTNWSRANIDALRAHLVDMDAVMLRAAVVSTEIDGGAAFDVTSSDARVTASVRAMTIAHARTMSGVDGLTIKAAEMPGGARMVVTGPDAEMIRGLGFFGVLALGKHHPVHHMALARGEIMPRG